MIMSLLVRQTAGADERTGSARQQPRRSLCRQSIGRDVRSVLALVFADITPARNSAGRGGCLGGKEARTGDGRHAAAGQGQGESLCLAEATCDTLRPPGRRIGQRGDATRAPTQGPRPGWAAGRRPSASRDWPECAKSIDKLCYQRMWQRRQRLSRARRAGKAAGSQGITLAWMLNRHETCVYLQGCPKSPVPACQPRGQTYVRI